MSLSISSAKEPLIAESSCCLEIPVDNVPITSKESSLEMRPEELEQIRDSSTEWDYLTGNYSLLLVGFLLLGLHLASWYILFVDDGLFCRGVVIPEYAHEGSSGYFLYYVRLFTFAIFLYVVGPLILLGKHRFNSPWLLMYWVFFTICYGVLLLPHLLYVAPQDFGEGTIGWVAASIQELIVPLILWGFAFCLHYFRRIGLHKNLYYGFHVLAGFSIASTFPIYVISSFCSNAIIAVIVSLLMVHLVIINYLSSFWVHAGDTAIHKPQNYKNKNLMLVAVFTLLAYIGFSCFIIYDKFM